MKIELLNGAKDLTELKSLYRKLAFKYHPDKETGSKELMQKLNAEYSYLLKNFDATVKEQQEEEQFMEELEKVIANIINCKGITIEVVGTWIWVSGDTKPHKEILKENGFHWNKIREIWQRKPSFHTGRVQYSKQPDKVIKDVYGCKEVKKKRGRKSKDGDNKTKFTLASKKED